ncbi:putative phosphoglycerate mutase [Halopolyspora algeriensis]|uniref:Putative phosphoglycerate mutase n=1 Tax=Halopolyspora algeriensis TaxID=1500506 RepID=A0A368W5I5_9ACTN|nr:histidine phosphatase family protein [Halopolyspora algeriensis]RCW47320.1 putative phosphoglycerate mutase [Halopolyspora algeriensis]TQM42555.1 putative phosphoglycerate mutase [Halopolyspora algeriensis]
MTASELLLPIGSAGVRLVLARHGQTPSNVRKVMDTLPPGPGLTEAGRSQAEGLAERLSAEKVVSIHASRAVRAQETAEPLARRHGIPVDVVDGIHEVRVGELEGSGDAAARRQFEDVYASWHAGRIDEPMPGGETGRQALTRFLAATGELLSDVTAGTVVMVSHGAILRLVAGHLAADVDSTRANSAFLPNAGIIVLEPAETATGWRHVQWEGLGNLRL